MTTHDGKVRMLDDTPRHFTPDTFDPRNARSAAARDGMIAMRREAGLPDFPAQPLYPDREVRFEPESSPTTRSRNVAG